MGGGDINRENPPPPPNPIPDLVLKFLKRVIEDALTENRPYASLVPHTPKPTYGSLRDQLARCARSDFHNYHITSPFLFHTQLIRYLVFFMKNTH